jgi:YggT family protein
MSPLGQAVYVIGWIFLLLLLFRLVMEYVFVFARSYEPKGLMLIATESAYTVTDPPLKALRRIIPPLRIGQVSLDLAFLVLFILVQLLISFVAPRL